MITRQRATQADERGFDPGVPMRLVPFAPKLSRPIVERDIVARPRLIKSLPDTGISHVVVTAPAGYGKTTLLAQWADADARPFAWLSIDDADNDPVVFLTYLALALNGVEPIEATRFAQLTGAPTSWEALLELLVEVLAVRVNPFVLALDDAHLLRGPCRDTVLPQVAAHIPPGSTLVIATRSESPLRLGRGRLSGNAHSIESGDLVMTAAEGVELLAEAGLVLDTEEAVGLVERTEGWPAGLQLAVLALRDRDDAEAALEEFAGSDRLVAEYLAEEVLTALPADDVEFLLCTSILARLSGDLCDAVFDRNGSGEVLARLARENRFVVALDRNGEWYRYHHLFGEMLNTEMHRRDAARAHQIANDASRWFESVGDVDGVIQHALAGHDLDRAAAFVWQAAPLLMGTRRGATVSRWLALFPPGTVENNPALSVTAAWAALTYGDIDSVHRYADAALRVPGEPVLPDGTPMAAAAALLRALSEVDGLERVRDNAALAFAGHPETSPYRALACFIHGSAMSLLGENDAARAVLEEGARLGRTVLPPARALCLAQLARIAAWDLDWYEAERLVDEALELVNEFGLTNRPAMGLVFSIAALVHGQRGARHLAEGERTTGLVLLPQIEDLSPYQILDAEIELIAASVSAGDLTSARSLAEDAHRRIARLPGAGVLPVLLARVDGMVEAASTRRDALVAPLTPAELKVLAYLPTHMSFGDIGEQLFVSRNTVKSHAMAIYRKLGVTSRGAAVTEARDLGLIGD